MKRILSLALALCLTIFGCIPASAANVANNSVSYPSGASSSSEIGVAVISSISRYAIDVTFSQTEFMLNSLVWNVDELDYEVIQTQSFESTPITVTVTNYSDKPILTWGSAVANTEVEIISIEPTYTVDKKLTIPGVVPDGVPNNTNGVNGKMAYYIKVPKGWQPPSMTESVVVGIISVYLSKA